MDFLAEICGNRFYTNATAKVARSVYAKHPTFPVITLIAYSEYSLKTGRVRRPCVVCSVKKFHEWATRELTKEERGRIQEDERGPSYHYHECKSCGHMWSHDPVDASFVDNTKEHRCIKCHAMQFERCYFNPTDDNAKRAKADFCYDIRNRKRKIQH